MFLNGEVAKYWYRNAKYKTAVVHEANQTFYFIYKGLGILHLAEYT